MARRFFSLLRMADRTEEIRHNLESVRSRIAAVSSATCPVRLVAVSKTKPVSDILAAYNCGQRHFGENYIQELVEKAPQLPSDIQWHFIGTLQSNKCKMVTSIPNLFLIETVDGKKKADILQKLCVGRPEPLRIFIQLNTSEEESKGGIPPSECLDVVKHVKNSCPNLLVAGIMTIGSPGNSSTVRPNPDFLKMLACQKELRSILGIEVELSMGMSDDFEHAIEMGSANVRVGSSIFGARAKNK